MAAEPQRRPDPLQPAWGPDHRVGGHRVVPRVVQEVGPVVNRRRPGLDRLAPARFRLHVGDPLRNEHPQDLLPRHLTLDTRRYHQVDEIVDVRQRLPVESPDRYGPAESLGMQVCPGRLDLHRVGFEAVYGGPLPGPERCGQTGVATAQVHDETASKTGLAQDGGGLLTRVSGPEQGHQAGGNDAEPRPPQGASTRHGLVLDQTVLHDRAGRCSRRQAPRRLPRSPSGNAGLRNRVRPRVMRAAPCREPGAKRGR